MKKNSCTIFFKLVALVVILSLLSPLGVSATGNEGPQPRASDYLSSYNTYICAMGSGKLQIWYSVVGVGDMDEIGVLSIQLYESSDKTNWTWKKTFLHESYSSMLIEDDFFHSSYVSYNGTAGKYYKAYVCIWAGKNGSGDTRYMWTPVERAT